MTNYEEAYSKIKGIHYINKIKIWIHQYIGVTDENSPVFQNWGPTKVKLMLYWYVNVKVEKGGGCHVNIFAFSVSKRIG